MSRLSITTRDDAGRDTPVFDVIAARNGDVPDDERDLSRIAGRICSDLDAEVGFTRNLNAGHFWYLGMFTLGWVILALARTAWPVLNAWWSGIMLAPFFALGGVMHSRWLRTHRARSIVRALLREHRCGSCGFSLRGLPASSELIKCPECGASWKLAAPVPAQPTPTTTSV